MDEVDTAADHMERERVGLLAQRKPEAPAANGYCLNCNAPVPRGLRWCDALCRDDYEKDNP